MRTLRPAPPHITLLAAAVIALAGTSCSRAAKLNVGDPAPQLQAGQWVQGEPVKEFEKGKAYIVEFWATWCGPCIVSIPHLNDLHLKFKDKGLVVIGQDVWERDESKVAPFVKKMGDKMTYRVALDDKRGSAKGKMAETWMEAAGQNGIPAAFVVDKQGLIAWIGHPMTLKEPLLEKVLAGTFDIKQAAIDEAKRREIEGRMRGIWAGLKDAKSAKDWAAAEAKLAEAEAILPPDEHGQLGMVRFDLLLAQKDYKGAYRYAEALSLAHQDNAMLGNELAWQIATRKGLEQRDLDIAETIANRANEAAEGKDANILDTVARVYFMKGDQAKAVAFQEKAVAESSGDRRKQFQDVLDSYKAGKLPN